MLACFKLMHAAIAEWAAGFTDDRMLLLHFIDQMSGKGLSMDLLAVLRVAARRWYILLPLLALSVIGGAAVSQQVKASYELTGILTISAPYVASKNDQELLSGNIFLDYNNTANIVGATADSPEVRTKIEAAGSNPDYKVQVSGSVVTVAISEDSAKRALDTYQMIIETLNARLDALQEQARVPPTLRVTVADILQPQGAQETVGNRQRVLLASVALGAILSIAICTFVDYLLAHRRPGRAG